MTEKRFTFTQDTLAKADVFDGSEFVCCTLSVWVEQLVDLLNQLNDENEQLKNENQKLDEKICLLTMDLIKTKSYEQLEKELNRIKNENEQLKKENIKLKNRNAYLDQHYGERTRKYFDGIEEWASGGH